MEQELWNVLFTLARKLDKRRVLGLYRHADIVGVFLWAVIHDRPTWWATKWKNWPEALAADIAIPSQSTMSRRLRSPASGQLLEDMENAYILILVMATSWIKIVDAKPLPVGGHSKDPDARWGHAVRTYAKGYKLFVVCGEGPLPLTWRVGAMNEAETVIAQRMLPDLQGGGYLLGDKLYDSNPLYAAARQCNHQLVAPRKLQGKGLGHRLHDPDRLRAAELLQTQFGQDLFAERERIEQYFAHLTNFGGGLAPLPNWVRRLYRVHQWVQGKILTYAAWIQQKISRNVIALA
jgi:Transposase DDE domain